MSHLSDAAGAMAATVRDITADITADQLADPTPCTEFDVRKLLNHLLFWGPSMAGAGRKEVVPRPAAAESDVDLTTGDWRGDLLAVLDRIDSSWAPASAWEGMTSMAGPEMPASILGDMIVGELVVHGWDLAAATGQRLDLPASLLTHLAATTPAAAEQARAMGLFGPEVTVSADAPALDRILGLTGRDPAWPKM
ncbi:TIGR03086 family metal-binding protein [Actinophytocola sp.]|uniref:TIGR03086 family metal-binding protein n=1 Tax=Actinophytocola sp. TaxID=1872138 RepID=UPI002D71313A|nr:TIGR03086 family metal-binding protein [Actinophytocola sp.]HYQ69686.1 TIGR03086 family metal-binding protein [Actinophytocola sp.]